MKLLKTVVILGLAVLSLGSSIAFGGCVSETVNDTSVATTVKGNQSSTAAPAPNGGVQSQAAQPSQ